MADGLLREPPRVGEDSLYAKWRHDGDPQELSKQLEEMWRKYAPICPDADFPSRMQRDFIGMLWQMALSVFLLERGHSLSRPPSDAPDLLVESSSRVWIECTAPSRGQESSPNYAVEPRDGKLRHAPERELLLRLTGSLSSKLAQVASRTKKGRVRPDDAVVVAMCGWRFGMDALGGDPSLAEKAVLGIGYESWVIDTRRGRVTDRFLNPQLSITKRSIDGDSDAEVSTAAFLDPEYERISALLWAPFPDAILNGDGDNVRVIRNSRATVPLPHGFFGFGTESELVRSESGRLELVRTPYADSTT